MGDDRQNFGRVAAQFSHSTLVNSTRGSAMAEGPHDAFVSRNSATTKHPI